jgi:hypothetical protein
VYSTIVRRKIAEPPQLYQNWVTQSLVQSARDFSLPVALLVGEINSVL